MRRSLPPFVPSLVRRPSLVPFVVSFVWLICLAPALGHAEPIRSRVSTSVGIAMPEGEVGVEYAVAPHRHFEVAVSAGLANLLPSGDERSPLPQFAIMPRARFEQGRLTLMFGVGLSEGRYHEGPFAFDDSDYLTRALWLNGEGSAIVEITHGWSAGVRVGAGRMLAHSKVEDLQHGGLTQDCSQVTMASGNDCTPKWDGAMPFLGLTAGKSF